MLEHRKAFAVDEQVAKILLDTSRPIGAYEIAYSLSRVAPAQVYRALERLVSDGKARRIATRNAFVAATNMRGLTVICCQCGEYELHESTEAFNALTKLCEERRIKINQIFLEMTGLCGNCQS